MSSRTVRKSVPLTLGLFSAMVDVESALDSTAKPLSLNQICVGHPGNEANLQTHEPAQTRQSLACPVCSNSDRGSFARGKDVGGGAFVIVPDEVLDQAGAESNNAATSIEIKAHPREQLGRSLNGDKAYFMVPANPAQSQAYAVIAAVIAARPSLFFTIVWAVKSAQAVYEVVSIDGRLALKQLAWPSAVNALPEVPTDYPERYLEQALMLVDADVTEYDPAAYVDTKSQLLLDYIHTATPVNGAVLEDGAVTASAPAVDLGAMLEAALAAKGIPVPGAESAPLKAVGAKKTPTPRKRATTRKTPTKVSA